MLAESWRLHYRSPAAKWEAYGLPIGNGRLGAVLRGDIARDVVQFNENSLWAGSNNYANGLCGVADDVFDTSMHGFGRYLDFGRVTISFAGLEESTVSGYERGLDLRHAVAYACFDAGGVRHQRSAFASREADVIVLRYSASAPFGCTVRLESAQGGAFARSWRHIRCLRWRTGQRAALLRELGPPGVRWPVDSPWRSNRRRGRDDIGARP